jgi:hypothetical protein
MDSMSAQDSLPMSAREGMMPARGGMMPAKRPKRPSLMARRRAMRGMPTGAGPAAPVGDAARMAEATAPAMMPEPPMGQPMMKKGGKMSKLNKEIRNESEEIGRVKAKLTKHEDKAASKAHKGLKTGGGKTSKKAFAAGGTVDSGKPVAMPQGRKKPSPPVLINQYAGTYKKGGSVTPAEGRLQKMFKKENAPAMKAAKADSNEKYAKGGALMSPKIGSVTETEKSVTVTPAKRGGAMRRGGGVC